MDHPRLRSRLDRLIVIPSLLVCVAACSGSGSGASTDGPDSGQAGGSTGAAGVSGSGGNAGGVAGSSGSAGHSGQGGTTETGGVPSAGGTTASAGKGGTGGTTGAGGTIDGGKTGGSTGTAGTGGKGGTGGTTSAGGSTGAGGSGAAGSTGSGDFGFTFRPVQSDKQLDYLCTLNAAGTSTYVYVRLDQTGTKSVGIATIPVFTPVLAKISVNGTVTDLANATYDYGGGHHNDSLQFDDQGKSYRYYHSSFGFGFRACQPMDCVSLYAQGGTTPTTDGCTSARALPEVCVPIKADGTHDPLKDTFKKCQGDSTK